MIHGINRKADDVINGIPREVDVMRDNSAKTYLSADEGSAIGIDGVEKNKTQRKIGFAFFLRASAKTGSKKNALHFASDPVSVPRRFASPGMTVIAILCMMLSGCLHDNPADYQVEAEARNIIFQPAVKNATATRGATPANGGIIQSNDNIPANGRFGVYAYSNISSTVASFSALQNMPVKNTGSNAIPVFTYSPEASWPLGASDELAFFGYYPWQDQGSTPTAGDPVIRVSMGATTSPSMTINYTCPTNPAKQADLMWSHTDFTDGFDPVEMVFGHALSRIAFKAAKQDYSAAVVITGITMKNVKTQGALSWTDDSDVAWSSLGTTADMTFTSSNGLSGTALTGVMSSTLSSTAADMVLIPQALDDIVVEVAATVGGETKTYTYPLDGSPEWEMNHVITYEMIIKGDGTMGLKTIVSDWDSTHSVTTIFDRQYRMTLSSDHFEINQNSGTFTLDIDTDCPAGIYIETDPMTFPTSWVNLNDVGFVSTTENDGASSRTLEIIVGANLSSIPRNAEFVVSSNNMHKVVNITQERKRNEVFNFIEYLNVRGIGVYVPTKGGRINAKAYTNMGWAVKTNIPGEEDMMDIPASETPEDYMLFFNIPPTADVWTSAVIEAWVEYQGTKMHETTFYQKGYGIDITGLPAAIDKGGQDVTLNLSGYFPAMNFRVLNETDASMPVTLISVLPCTATGSLSADGTSSVTFTIYQNASGASRDLKFQYEKSAGVWVDIATLPQAWNGTMLPATGGNLAPPGIIGIGAVSGKLTLDGSQDYEGGTAGETVYVALFKWGSTVAVNQTVLNDMFDKTDVGWLPPGFNRNITNDMSSIPIKNDTTFPATDNKNGWGDPCEFAEWTGAPTNWRTPTMSEVQSNVDMYNSIPDAPYPSAMWWVYTWIPDGVILPYMMVRRGAGYDVARSTYFGNKTSCYTLAIRYRERTITDIWGPSDIVGETPPTWGHTYSLGYYGDGITDGMIPVRCIRY